MSQITPKQQAFAQAYIETGNASEAYRQVYNVSQMSQPNIAKEASRLLANPHVAPILAEAREKSKERLVLTLQTLTDELEDARRLAMGDEKGASAAVSAIMGKAKLHGFLVDRSENVNHNYEISDKPLSAEEWAEKYAKPN